MQQCCMYGRCSKSRCNSTCVCWTLLYLFTMRKADKIFPIHALMVVGIYLKTEHNLWHLSPPDTCFPIDLPPKPALMEATTVTHAGGGKICHHLLEMLRQFWSGVWSTSRSRLWIAVGNVCLLVVIVHWRHGKGLYIALLYPWKPCEQWRV